MTKELAESIKRLRGIDEGFSGQTLAAVRDARRALCYGDAIQTIDQLVDLVAEMREVMVKCKRDYDVSLNNSRAAEAIMGDSYPERMQNDINRKFVIMQLNGINRELTKADALLSGLKEESQ